jgi:hypothetical protein
MNWPDKLNALNTQLSDALNDAWALFESDTSACVAVLAEPSAEAQTSPSASVVSLKFVAEIESSSPKQFGFVVCHSRASALSGARRNPGFRDSSRGRHARE